MGGIRVYTILRLTIKIESCSHRDWMVPLAGQAWSNLAETRETDATCVSLKWVWKELDAGQGISSMHGSEQLENFRGRGASCHMKFNLKCTTGFCTVVKLLGGARGEIFQL